MFLLKFELLLLSESQCPVIDDKFTHIDIRKKFLTVKVVKH